MTIYLLIFNLNNLLLFSFLNQSWSRDQVVVPFDKVDGAKLSKFLDRNRIVFLTKNGEDGKVKEIFYATPADLLPFFWAFLYSFVIYVSFRSHFFVHYYFSHSVYFNRHCYLAFVFVFLKGRIFSVIMLILHYSITNAWIILDYFSFKKCIKKARIISFWYFYG